MRYYHADVFSAVPLRGNGLTAVFPDRDLPDDVLLEITREFKQFETIFLYPPVHPGVHPARIFTVDEELEFAGHPVLGAGAILHMLLHADAAEVSLTLDLRGRPVSLRSRRVGPHCQVTMNQGRPVFGATVTGEDRRRVAEALGLDEYALHDTLPLETVSTGLPYLLVPLRSGLAESRIAHADAGTFLAKFGARFVYVFDVDTLECRTWDNIAHTEDVATGSAAGPLCAYLVQQGRKAAGEEILLRQGRFVGRDSVIRGIVGEDGVLISGDVALFASGVIVTASPW